MNQYFERADDFLTKHLLPGIKRRREYLERVLDRHREYLSYAIFAEDADGVKKINEKYVDFNFPLRCYVEAKQGEIEYSFPVNQENITTPEQQRFVDEAQASANSKYCTNWTKNAKRCEETDDLVLRFLAGHLLSEVAARSLSGENLIGDFKVPSLEDLQSTESLDELFDPANSFLRISQKLRARYIDSASRDNLFGAWKLNEAIHEKYSQ